MSNGNSANQERAMNLRLEASEGRCLVNGHAVDEATYTALLKLVSENERLESGFRHFVEVGHKNAVQTVERSQTDWKASYLDLRRRIEDVRRGYHRDHKMLVKDIDTPSDRWAIQTDGSEFRKGTKAETMQAYARYYTDLLAELDAELKAQVGDAGQRALQRYALLVAAAQEVLRTQGYADEAGGTIDEQIAALEQMKAVLDGE